MLTHRPRRGSTSTTVAVLLPVLIGFVALGVDFGVVAVAQHQVQAAADAAAIAATTSMGDIAVARTRARAFATETTFNNVTVQVADEEVELGFWDGVGFTPGGSPNAVRVTARADVPMYFARLFGFDSVPVAAVAGAGPGVIVARAPDTVIVLDVTGSMSPSEVAAERDAAEALVDCIDRRSSSDSRAAIATFTGVDHALVGMSDFSSGYDLLGDTARGINGCGSADAPPCSGTNPASGYQAALEILAGAATPEDVGQAIVFMSDGLPNPRAICTPAFFAAEDAGEVLFDLQDHCADVLPSTTATLAQYAAWASEAQAAAEAAEIDVFTVYYGTDAAGAVYLETQITAGEGFAQVALSPGEIEDAFIDICVATTGGIAGLLF